MVTDLRVSWIYSSYMDISAHYIYCTGTSEKLNTDIILIPQHQLINPKVVIIIIIVLTVLGLT